MARKIETLMNQAIANGIDWSRDNTRVRYDETTETSSVFLYNKLIAIVGEGWIMLRDGGVQSKTTKSRLAAILRENGDGIDAIRQVKGQWMVTTKNGEIPFVSGMILRD